MKKQLGIPVAKRAGALVLALALAVIFAACGASPGSSSTSSGDSSAPPQSASQPQSVSPSVPEPPEAVLGIGSVGADNYPRVDGSTANLPLMAEIYSTVCGVPLADAETLVAASRTADAWDGLVAGDSDLLLVYEAPVWTGAKIRSSGVELEIYPIGVDALVFLTNRDNPVNGLTADQLRSIYTGALTNWSEVGGANAEIAAFQRNEDSGSQAMFLKLLMGNTLPMEPRSEWFADGMIGLLEALSGFDGAANSLGYSVYYYASLMNENPQLKFLEVDGVAPTAETIADGSYPFTNEFFVVIRADEPLNSPARILRDWILGAQGNEALLRAGYIPA